MAPRTARTSALLATLRAVRRLRPQDLWRADAVPSAWLGALAVETSLARLGFDRTLRWIEKVPRRRLSVRRQLTVAETKRVVAVAYRLQPFEGRCLSRSLVAYLLHRRDGAHVRFVVGVRRAEDAAEGEDLEAHAWVESAGTPGDEPFTELLVATSAVGR
jgi:hypothetical protein